MGRVTNGVETMVDTATVTRWMRNCAATFSEQRDYLTQLDAAIGDADHGTNLSRGFTAVLAALEEARPATPGAVLTLTGSTLISKVGGASGPLYGMAFRRAGKSLGDQIGAPQRGAPLFVVFHC